MLDCFLAASYKCIDSNLCKSSSIRDQLFHNHCFLVLFLFIRWLFQCSKILWFGFNPRGNAVSGYTILCSDVFVWETFSRFLKAWNFSPKLFTLSFRLTEDMLLHERCWKKREQTSEQTFDNAVIDIRMPEMDSMIHSKASFKCSKWRMGNTPKMTEGTERNGRHTESLRYRSSIYGPDL